MSRYPNLGLELGQIATHGLVSIGPWTLTQPQTTTCVSTLERSGLVRVSQEGTGWLAKADGIGKG